MVENYPPHLQPDTLAQILDLDPSDINVDVVEAKRETVYFFTDTLQTCSNCPPIPFSKHLSQSHPRLILN